MKPIYHYCRDFLKGGFLLILTVCPGWGKFAAQVSTEISAGITAEANGEIVIELNGNWHSEGTLLPGISTLLLSENGDQDLRQDQGGFYNITINKASGDVFLTGHVTILGGTLLITGGDMELNGHQLTLDPMSLLNEAPGNTIKGTSGYVTTTREINSPSSDNIGGMGLALSATDYFGSTEVRRGHSAQVSNGTESILRYFDILPELNGVTLSTLRFYSDESELNANTETDLKLYRSDDNGTNWIEVFGMLDVDNNYYEAEDVVSSSRYTLSSHCLETCVATQALVKSHTLYLNAAGLAVLFPQDIDDGTRGACGIDTLVVFPDVFDCSDIGSREVLFTVTDNNGCTNTAIAMVNVFDTIPPLAVCKDITLALDNLCEDSIIPQDVDNGSNDPCDLSLSIDISLFDCEDLGSNEVMLTATDASGNMSQCISTVTVLYIPDVICQEAMLDMDTQDFVVVNGMSLVDGDPEDFEGYSFQVDPDTFYCDQLGDQLVTLTVTDPLGNVTVCETTITVTGPDADCDGVADQCDLCHGGDDLQDNDDDGIPDCADWDGFVNLIEEWQCANNKVFICHEGQVICINENAVTAHLDHGDFLGSCYANSCDEPALQMNGVDLDLTQTNHEAGVIDYNAMNLDDSFDNTMLTCSPNPFKTETVIRFYLQTSQQISVSVFDMIGNKVTTVTEGIYDSGWHQVKFIGEGYSEGVYFISLQSANNRIGKAVVMSK